METSVIIALIGLITSIGGFHAGRRMRRAETVGKELDNMQKAIQQWKDIAEYQTGEICALRKEIDALKKEISSVERMHREQFTEYCQNCKNNS
jgi:septal ring factor EnvC (AmiA/AmiB activator)